MKQYKIYGQKYPLTDYSNAPIDSYAYKGELVDEEPSGKHLGFVTMEDGSIVSCYKGRNVVLPVLASVSVLALLVGVGAFVAPMIFKEPDVVIGGTMLQTEVNNNVVTFNGIMKCSDGMVDVRFVNGDTPATIQITGEGIESEVITLEPGQEVEQIPVTLSTSSSVVKAKVSITSNGSTSDFDTVIEVPDNGTVYDPEGVTGFFDKELIVNELYE